MMVRIFPTVAALAALLLAGGAAMAGGMPSDEGPDVVLGEPELEALFTPTITTIIEEELPQYIEASWLDERPADAAAELSLPPAISSPPARNEARPFNRLHPEVVSLTR